MKRIILFLALTTLIGLSLRTASVANASSPVACGNYYTDYADEFSYLLCKKYAFFHAPSGIVAIFDSVVEPSSNTANARFARLTLLGATTTKLRLVINEPKQVHSQYGQTVEFTLLSVSSDVVGHQLIHINVRTLEKS